MTSTRPRTSVQPSALDATAPSVLQRRLLTPITIAFAATAGFFALLDLTHVDVPYTVQVIPFAISVLLFGLPHGALDHLVPARMDPRITVRRSIAAVVALYALLGGATALLWVLLPPVGFTLFIAVTWFHWGQGDLWLDRALTRSTPSRLDATLTVLVRGALPMLLPLVAHPHDYATVFQATTRLLDPSGGTGAAVFGAAPVRLAAATLLAALVALHLAIRHRRHEVTGTMLAELAVLGTFFIAVPPVLAVGFYFTFWHAVRHILRLELFDPGSRAALQHGGLLRPFRRFLKDALPVTLCAVGLLLALAVALHHAGLGTYLLLIAALTTPHTAVVTWMDRRRAAGERHTPAGSAATESGARSRGVEVEQHRS